MTKAGSKCWKQNEEETEEEPENLSDDKETGVDDAIIAVLSEAEVAFSHGKKIKQWQYSGGQRGFVLLPTGFGKSFVKHCGTSWLAMRRRREKVTPCINKKPGAVSTCLNRQ